VCKFLIKLACHNIKWLIKHKSLIFSFFREAGEGLVELRKLEAAEDIAYQLSKSRNVTYLPQGQQTLLSLPQ
jgi:prohibitin 1